MFKKLEEKFRLHCDTRNLELNPNQIFVIKKLENYYKDNFRSSIFSFFSKEVSKKSFYLCPLKIQLFQPRYNLPL